MNNRRICFALLAGLLAFAAPVYPARGAVNDVVCETNWCEVVQGPSGSITYTNVNLWPETNICLGSSIYAYPEANEMCRDVVTRSVWSPASANCPTTYSTNTSCPYYVTNWYVVSGPGSYSETGGGNGPFGIAFTPTNCGSGTVTFYAQWKNTDPCTGQPTGGGTTSKSVSFKVTNVDIVDSEKTACLNELVSFTLTNTCDTVTWEVLPSISGGPNFTAPGELNSGMIAGTWTVSARSLSNSNCVDSCTLTTSVGFRELLINGSTAGTMWSPEWATKLVNVAALVVDSGLFSFSSVPTLQLTNITVEKLFCCTNGGSGVTTQLERRGHLQSGFNASASLSPLTALPDWLEIPIGILTELFPTNTSLITAVENIINIQAGFNASGSSSFGYVTFSDECFGCQDNPEMFLGTSGASVSGDVGFHSDLLDVHVIGLGGWLDTQTQGSIWYIGPDSLWANWRLETRDSWFLYSSYVIGARSSIKVWVPQGSRTTDDPPTPLPVCLGPNYTP